MHRISTPLLALATVLFSTATWSQNVTLSNTDLTPEANELHSPILAKDNFGKPVSTNIALSPLPH